MSTSLTTTSLAAALLLCGCAGMATTQSSPAQNGRLLTTGTAPSVSARPGGSDEVSSLLAGATEVQPVIVDLPPLQSWPRYLRSAGPLYGLVQLSPYVGQFGILSDSGRADSGMGFGAVFGYRIPLSAANTLGFEVIYETSSHHNDASNVDANATRVVAGMRANFKMDERTVPFAVAGLGKYDLKFDQLDPKFDLSGMGVMLGGGVNISPSPRFSFRAEMALHIWDAAQASGDGGMAETLTIGLGSAFSF